MQSEGKPKIALSPEQVAAFTLSRQHLSQPAKQASAVVRDLVAVQAQHTWIVPIALWARTADPAQDWIDRALLEKKTLVRTWCLRGTVHVLRSCDLAMVVQAVGDRQASEHEHFMKTRRGIEATQIRRMERAVMRALAKGALSRSDLHRAAPELAKTKGASWGLDVRSLAFTGDLVFADSQGAESRFARRDVWLPDLEWEPPSPEEARRELLVRYLAGYGLATMQDFAHWTGLKMKDVRAAFEACEGDIVPAEVEGWRGTLYLRAQDEEKVGEVDSEMRDVCLLPKFDSLLMAYRDKMRFLDEDRRSRVFRPAAEVEAVVLVRGKAAATWRMKRKGDSLTLTVFPFDRLRRGEQSGVRDASQRLATFLGATEVDLVFDYEESAS